MKGKSVYIMTVGELLDCIEKEEAISNEDIEKVVKKYGKLIGVAPEEMDGDLLTGELRDDGVRVLNLNEQWRKKHAEN